ncbi:MAG TPA: FAD binding domain-containing protein [Alphaproteobacteria bacterium]|nr:FAD binding domain-containing protein [Alphaproteobacteria bacterium]
MGSYLRPTTIDDALAALAAKRHTILAGGTDFYPARVGRPLRDDVLDITGLAALRTIKDEGEAWRIGCLATWTDLVRKPLPPCFDGLKQAARAIGGVQIQNAGTLCGNVCNASPAADGIPNLLALDAEVELASLRGERRVPLAAFVTGNRMTARQGDELVTALLVPKPRRPARSRFLKLGARKYLVISIVMAAGVIEAAEDGRVAAARIAIGACSAVAQRLPALEAVLRGRALDAKLGNAVSPAHLAPLSPIDDVRGAAAYRRDAALTMLRRLLGELGAGA